MINAVSRFVSLRCDEEQHAALQADSGRVIKAQSLEAFMAVFINLLQSFIKRRRLSRKSERE